MAILADGKSRAIEIPGGQGVNLDDFYAVLEWTKQRSQEWLYTVGGNGAVRRDAVVEFQVIDTEPLVG